MNSSNSPSRRRRRTVQTASLGGAMAVAAVAATAFAPAATAAGASVSYTCTTALGPSTVTEPITLTVPATVAAGGTIAVGAIHVTPGAFSPAITSPVALNTTVQDTLSITLTDGTAKVSVDLVGPTSAQQVVAAGGAPANAPFTNTTAVTVPSTFGAGTMTWNAGNEVLTAVDKAYGKQLTSCVVSGTTALATSTVTGGGGGTPPTTTTSAPSGGGKTSTATTSAPAGGGSTTTMPSVTTTSTATSIAAGGGPTGTPSTTAAATVLPHTGFDGTQLVEVAGAAAVLGAGSIFLSRKRRGTRA